MKKIISVCFIFLIFFLGLSFANANLYWSQEANANYDLGVTGVRGIAYGSNYLNPIENITGSDYYLCPITKSDYTPIVSDFGQTGELKVVVTDKSTDKLSVYNPDCTLFQEIYIDEDIIAMPVLLRPKNYFDQQIVVLTTNRLKSYEYDLDLGYFVEKLDVSNRGGFPSRFQAYYLTCLDELWDSARNPKCIVVGWGEADYSFAEIIDMVDGTYIEEAEILEYDDYGYYYLRQYDGYNGLSNIRNPIDENDFYLPFGFYRIVSDKYYGNLLDGTANYLAEYHSSVFSYHFKDSLFVDSSDFVARIGNSYRLFSYRYSGNSSGNSYYSSVFINDLSGNNLFYLASTETGTGTFDMDNVTYKRFSNWAVADYDKDGSNEACFLVKKVNDEVWLQCYESTLSESNGDIRINYTGLINNVSNIVLADFIPGKNVLGIATREGIFYPNDKVFSTNKSADFGFPITTISNIYSQVPMYVYTDSDEGFIVYADVELDSCGNGDCEYWESPLSCCDYDDCLAGNSTRCDCCYFPPDVDYEGEYREGSPCETDDDCEGNLICEYGVCTKLIFGGECEQDSDCLSGECLNGYCTKTSWWNKLSASKDQQFGDDVNTNNFIALFFIIAIAGYLMFHGNILAGILAMFILAIFFTIVGWLSVFILFGFILTGLIAIVIKMMVGGQSG